MKKDAKIKVYSTPTCPYCYMVKDFLKSKGVEFEDIDVSSNRNAAREMISKTGMTAVPQIEINGKMIIGFDREALESELKNMKKI
jgi:glutaredoxin 3